MRLTVSYYLFRLKPFVYLFLFLETLLRLILLVHEHGNIDWALADTTKLLAAGLVMDVGVLVYFLLPFCLYLVSLPARLHGTRKDRIASAILFGMFAYVLLFTHVGEWFFWDEFAARYNFIAVDYLIYTQEVIGNIRESYPVLPLLVAIAAIASLLAFWQYRTASSSRLSAPLLGKRLAAFGVVLLLAATSFFMLRSWLADISGNRYLNQIARNGIYELFAAYRNNELPYDQFYVTEDEQLLMPVLQQRFGLSSNADNGITRHIVSDKPETPYNLVLITVESLSADYMKAFGNTENLTPNLDRLAEKSLFFTNLYATGTRTVYGLSAITLSIPPLPGNSIVRRPENEGLFSLGAVLNRKGYESKFIYGGYGYFDNMNYFFSNNGYGIVDRNDLHPEEITFANVWGVADEDLLNRVLKENDHSYAAKKPFFQMILTTSNHRPFTYPDGKIDIPSKSGRKGGVKYTDYAIGQFLKEARKHSWFNNTVFVIVADHTAGSAGKSELNPAGYHIPMLVYAPGIIAPKKVDALSSQIDVAPTLLGLLNMSYDSRFFGQDIMKGEPCRAFISNYQQLGYLTKEKLMVIKPIKQEAFYRKDGEQFLAAPADDTTRQSALSYFQSANNWKTWNKDIDNPVNLAFRKIKDAPAAR